MTDLIRIGSSGVRASQRQLLTTGHNISNVNSDGHSVQRTLYTADELGGTGRGETERVVNQFAQAAVWRDTSTLASREAYLDSVSAIDSILSDDSLSLGGKLDSTFSSLHAMNDTPTALSTRELSITQFQALTDRFYALSEQYRVQQEALNDSLEEKAGEANELVASIFDMNQQVTAYTEPYASGGLDTLLDKRDEAIRELSELIQINTIEQDNGAKLIYMQNGTSLILEKDYGELSFEQSDPDNTQLELVMTLNSTSRRIGAEHAGGELGAIMAYREEDLNTSRNQLGQLALAMGDGFNRQNGLGMDLNDELGGDIFTLPNTEAMAFDDNTGTGEITASVIAGEGSSITPYDYEVTFTSATNFEVQRYSGGEAVGSAETGTASAAYEIDGLTLDMSTGTFAADDQYLLQPTRDAARQLEVLITDAEALALAAPVRVAADLDNTGNGEIQLYEVTDTDPTTSAFTSPGGLDTTAPQEIQVNAAGDYEIYDSTGTLLGTALASSGTDGIFANASLTPGYDVSLSGDPQIGDVFTIEYNSGGYADNYNGLRLVDMQQGDLVRKGLSTTGDSQMTLNEAYSSVVSYIGGKTSEARTDVSAADALLTQSENWYSSISGVNLDEEASNLVRFQQAYAASARVISVAKETFDTILASAR